MMLQPAPAPPPTESTTCPVAVPRGTKCGFLLVPERRDAPGKTIKVGYAVSPSTARARKPDPIVYTSGGPGSSSIQLTGFLRQMFPDRDVITLEQRGSRYSQPRLACPETVKAMLDRLRAPAADVGRAAATCRTRLQEQGVDLRGYTTKEIAADVGALRQALGYSAWNLFGVSYSTRSMLDAAAADPEGVRSLVLDSFLPESVDWYGDADRNLADILNALGVRAPFDAMVKRLNARPARVPTTDPQLGTAFTARLTGDDVATIMAEALHEPTVSAVAPALITALADGNDELLGPLADAVGDGLTSYEFGLYHAVQCQDEPPHGPSRLFTVTADQAVCAAWRLPASKPVNATTKAPVLVVGGQYDPTTPSRTSRPAAEKLDKARFVEFAGLGHAVFLGGPCARQTIVAFVADPAAASAPCDPAAPAYRRFAPDDLIVSGAPYQARSSPWLLAPLAVFGLVSLLQFAVGAMRGMALTAYAGLSGMAFTGLLVQSVVELAGENEVALAVGLPASVGWIGWLAVCSAVLTLAALVRAAGKFRMWPFVVTAAVADGFLVWWWAWVL